MAKKTSATTAAAKPATKAVAKPATKAVAKPATKAVAKPAVKAPAKPAAKVAAKATAKPAVKAPAKPVVKAAVKASAVAPQVASPKVVAKPAVAKATPAKASTKDVVFTIYSPDSQSVAIAGTFNSWDPAKGTMKKNKDGNWILKVKLGFGQHQYKVVYDGAFWEPDQNAPSIATEHGHNSIINVE